jgi:hypothetical protein
MIKKVTFGLQSEILRITRDHWLMLRAEKPMPAKKDFDPISLPKSLPHIAIAEVFHEPLRFRFRLVGTYINNLAGRDATGLWIDEHLYGERTEKILEVYSKCVNDRAPVATRRSILFSESEWTVVETLFLPFENGDGLIDHVFAVVNRLDNAPPMARDDGLLLQWQNND